MTEYVINYYIANVSGLNYCPRLTWTYVSYVFDQLPGVVAQVPKFKSWRSKEGTPLKTQNPDTISTNWPQ